jgi:hypothetical protein
LFGSRETVLKTIVVPPAIRAGIRPGAKPFKPGRVYALDFETVDGKPYTLQIADESGVSLKYLKRPADGLNEILDRALDFPSLENRFYCWFAPFDFPCLFFRWLSDFAENDFEKCFDYAGYAWKLKVSCARSWFARLSSDGGHHVRLLDAYQFWRCSLDKAAEKIFGERKHKKPRGLGSKRLKGAAFESYAKRDADLTRRLAMMIEKQHQSDDVLTSVSASEYAAKIFRRGLQRTIPYVPPDVEAFGLLSYHGGLNYCCPNVPVFIKGVYEYDITSAYPEAFCQLPDFTAGEWSPIDSYKKGIHGFYKIYFDSQCAYAPCRDARFQILPSGETVVTSYEIDSAIPCMRRWFVSGGYYFCAEKRRAASPFTPHMRRFFKLKDTATDPVQKDFAKICLNGISGKLIQNRETAPEIWEAGGLFNPAIASLVTGYTRAKIHGLMHRYGGFHCATDSFFTRRGDVPETKGMGGLKKSCYGDLLLLRNKLYLFFKPGKPYTVDNIIKGGFHGFQGRVQKDGWTATQQMGQALIDLWKHRAVSYKVDRIYRAREALARRLQPLTMLKGQERRLAVDWTQYKEC